MNDVVELKPQAGALAQTGAAGRMAVADIISHVATVQEVMRAVMKPEVHYGKIPGAGDKPTLLKAGAEVLCMVFRIADEYRVEDLSTADMVRYRVTCIGKHQVSGAVLGEGMGEASSGEEKYKWRKAVCDEEWDETPANLRRVKHARGKGGTFYKAKQVRTEPADIANTVLKMANKRAKMAMVLNVTAASDCFAQDLEDMDEALRDHLARHGDDVQPDQPAGPAVWPDDAFDKQLPKLRKALADGKPLADIISWLETKGQLTEAQRAKLQPQAEAPAITYAALAARLARCTDADTAALIVDEGRALPADQQADLSKLYAEQFGNKE